MPMRDEGKAVFHIQWKAPISPSDGERFSALWRAVLGALLLSTEVDLATKTQKQNCIN